MHRSQFPRAVVVTWLSIAAVGLLACTGNQEKQPEGTLGLAQAALIPLEPVTIVEPGAPSTRLATCPHHRLPDQCGTWAGVELQASRGGGKSSRNDDEGTEDSHCLCQGIDFQIPATLPVTKGRAGWAWDKAELSFRKASGDIVECSYRGNGAPHGRGGDAYVLERCSRGFKAGQTAHSDWFELELDDGHPHGEPVEVSLRLGAPDVVGGVVQEQVFYANDPRIPGAALHVPRGSAPPFETFSLSALPQVPPGTALQSGTATSLGYGVDVHSDMTDNFVFTPVAGAGCPRIELPYDQATLERLHGPGSESALQANQLLTLTNITNGTGILASAGPVTVNLAQHTVSFCVEHLSFWVATGTRFRASISSAFIDGPGVTQLDMLTSPTPPLLTPGQPYTLKLTFKNGGSDPWTSAFSLYAVDQAVYPTPLLPGSVATVNKYVPPAQSPWKEVIGSLTNTPVSGNGAGEGSVTVTLVAPNKPAPLNFCLASEVDVLFGLCFSWETTFGGGAASFPMVEVCDGEDNDLDGDKDEGLKVTVYPDGDHDGHGDPNRPTDVCPGTPGYVADNTDCDDSNPALFLASYYPDCDGDTHGKNEICYQPAFQESTPIYEIPPVVGCVAKPDPVIIDWRGGRIVVNYVTSDDDCSPYSDAVYPGATETCNYFDNNCNGSIDDEVRDVSYRYDLDNDGWCQPTVVLGCSTRAPNSGMLGSQYCQLGHTQTTFIPDDCNDSNSQANRFCGEYEINRSDTYDVGGGLFGTITTRTFHSGDCGPGWHISKCESFKTEGAGKVSISSCPTGAQGGDVSILFELLAFQGAKAFARTWCQEDASYP